MLSKTTKVKAGIWEVPGISTNFEYRVCSQGENRPWTIFKKLREPVGDPEDITPDAQIWELVETGFRSKASAVEYVGELVMMENFNPVADLLNNIDDGINLNNEGG